MREKYESLSLAVLKELAKSRGLKGISTLKKAALVERMLQEDEKEAQKAHAGEAEHDANLKNRSMRAENVFMSAENVRSAEL